jgi:hypothetical protein
MKVGISVKIDVTKIDKTRLFKGEKGTYLDLTTFVELDEKDQYDNNGFITQEQTKEEREAGTKLPILGNVKVFWRGEGAQAPAPQAAPQAAIDPIADDDIPF